MSVSYPPSTHLLLCIQSTSSLPNVSAFNRGTALLSNDYALPTVDASTECFEENLLPNGTLLPNSAHMSISSLYQFLVLTGTFSPKMLEGFRVKRRHGEKNIWHKRSIYRGKGAVSRKRLDMTVVIFLGDACPLQRSKDNVFLPKFEILFVESDHRSQPASPRG
jgi:hypothetical protein